MSTEEIKQRTRRNLENMKTLIDGIIESVDAGQHTAALLKMGSLGVALAGTISQYSDDARLSVRSRLGTAGPSPDPSNR